MDDKQAWLFTIHEGATDEAPWFLCEERVPHPPVRLEEYLSYTKDRVAEICRLKPGHAWPDWEPYAAACVAAYQTDSPMVLRAVCKAIISVYAWQLMEAPHIRDADANPW